MAPRGLASEPGDGVLLFGTFEVGLARGPDDVAEVGEHQQLGDEEGEAVVFSQTNVVEDGGEQTAEDSEEEQ